MEVILNVVEDNSLLFRVAQLSIQHKNGRRGSVNPKRFSSITFDLDKL